MPLYKACFSNRALCEMRNYLVVSISSFKYTYAHKDDVQIQVVARSLNQEPVSKVIFICV